MDCRAAFVNAGSFDDVAVAVTGGGRCIYVGFSSIVLYAFLAKSERLISQQQLSEYDEKLISAM
jgi:hypothetical protein